MTSRQPRPDNRSDAERDSQNSSEKEADNLLQKITERVWELWREDLRRTRERKGSKTRR